MRRRFDKEIMDDFSITDERIVRALDELRIINTFLGGRSTSLAGIRELLRKDRRNRRSGDEGDATERTVTVLDVGAGGSDLFASGSLNGRGLNVVSVDINSGVCWYVKAHDERRNVVCADALRLPFAENSVDVVHVSLFLHHFTEEEIGRLLDAFLRIARIGIVVNDLHRSYAALAGITLLTQIFSRSAMVKNDGPLSVKRGFARGELSALLRRLPCASFTLRWRWAFRWLAVIHKEAIHGQ